MLNLRPGYYKIVNETLNTKEGIPGKWKKLQSSKNISNSTLVGVNPLDPLHKENTN